MMFISLADITLDLDESKKNQLIEEIERYFCSLLPIKKEKRVISYYPDQVYLVNGWLKVNTQLLNITSVAQRGLSKPFKAIGRGCQELLFAGSPSFDPLLELEVESGYDEESLPGDIKILMLELIRDQASQEAQERAEKSVKMWPREVVYATDLEAKKISIRSERLKAQIDEVLSRYRY